MRNVCYVMINWKHSQMAMRIFPCVFQWWNNNNIYKYHNNVYLQSKQKTKTKSMRLSTASVRARWFDVFVANGIFQFQLHSLWKYDPNELSVRLSKYFVFNFFSNSCFCCRCFIIFCYFFLGWHFFMTMWRQNKRHSTNHKFIYCACNPTETMYSIQNADCCSCMCIIIACRVSSTSNRIESNQIDWNVCNCDAIRLAVC